jgi:hypothetical protein
MNDMNQIDRRAVMELLDAYIQLKKINPKNIKRNAYQEYM